MKNEQQEIGDSLLKTFNDSETIKLIPDMADIGMHFITENQIFKEIPIFGTIYTLSKGAFAIRDYFLIKKICYFLQESKSIDEKSKRDFTQKLAQDSEYATKIGENIVNILDRFDQVSKASAFARILGVYIEGKISYKEYQEFSYALEKINYENIELLKEFYEHKLNFKMKVYLQPFVFTGLVSLSVSSEREIPGFNQNTLGQRFLAALGFENFKKVLSQRNFVDCGEGVSEFGMGAPLNIVIPPSKN
ncbi:hypothetical protein [Nostoc foliaceum]|uniref:Uncharacterized protein n=1 Tax=Nostoc foliaceum FACHB-393 TaxID=2692915 RepID=A0ABR8IJN2_9NOSO|nr:hypothetical protein [Nostoc foliaceum]MBD2651796.1 hypothetical protein [Nostoc foliaceum FACHB-393]